jgi:hypothetical protein
MNQDEVLATLHRVVQENKHYTTWTISTPHLVALVREVIEQEREACAKVCDKYNFGQAPKMIQNAIRARGDNK